jgi:hypothetical protein
MTKIINSASKIEQSFSPSFISICLQVSRMIMLPISIATWWELTLRPLLSFCWRGLLRMPPTWTQKMKITSLFGVSSKRLLNFHLPTTSQNMRRIATNYKIRETSGSQSLSDIAHLSRNSAREVLKQKYLTMSLPSSSMPYQTEWMKRMLWELLKLL